MGKRWSVARFSAWLVIAVVFLSVLAVAARVKARQIALLGFVAASPGYASPTYLDCKIDNGDTSFSLKVTVDEENQIVTVLDPSNGYSDRGPAVFTARLVSLTRPLGHYDTVTYEIDRVGLKLLRRIGVGEKRIENRGTCKVDAVAKRAF